jgi:hypothetical protein
VDDATKVVSIHLKKRCEDLKLLRCLTRPSLRHEKQRSFLFSRVDLLPGPPSPKSRCLSSKWLRPLPPLALKRAAVMVGIATRIATRITTGALGSNASAPAPPLSSSRLVLPCGVAGWTSSPRIWTSVMSVVAAALPLHGMRTLLYVDDLLIACSSFEEASRARQIIEDTLLAAGIVRAPLKGCFGMSKPCAAARSSSTRTTRLSVERCAKCHPSAQYSWPRSRTSYLGSTKTRTASTWSTFGAKQTWQMRHRSNGA